LFDFIHVQMYCGLVAGTLVEKMHRDAIERHAQIISLIQTESESVSSAYSVWSQAFFTVESLMWNVIRSPALGQVEPGKDTSILHTFSTLTGSSSVSIPLLPAVPKIFHGRENIMKGLLDILVQAPARVAILGSGGIGKTSVATALLHYPRIIDTFSRRYIVSCDSVHTTQGLLISVAAHLGMSVNKQLSQSIVRYFSDRGPSLLVLDNFETPWEFLECRPSIEEFLSLLTDVDHLALVVRTFSLIFRS
jgi:hypothetical protein